MMFTQYLLLQTLKVLPHPLHLAQFGVIHHKVITSVTKYIPHRRSMVLKSQAIIILVQCSVPEQDS